MSEKESPTERSKSICEAALEHYSTLDDSLAELIKQASIEVRDFMILSFVCDQGCMIIEQISRALGLGEESTQECVDRLIMARLVHYKRSDSETGDNLEVTPTSTGRRVARRIHGDSD